MNIFKKITAVLAVSSILLTFAACNGTKETETTTAAATREIVETTDSLTEKATVEAVTEEMTTEPITEEKTTEEETTTQASTTTKKTETTTKKVVTTTKKPATAKKTTTAKPTTTKKSVTAPTSKADIVKLYNNATAAAASSKPGYKKSTNTTLNNLNMGALASIDAVRGAVGDFLGEGSSSETVKKGSFNGTSLVKSSLKESDVTAATCKLSSDGKYYIVNITVKNEQNPQKGGSALGRFTKDFKDIDEVQKGLAEVGASVGSITINTTSVTINAKISVANNRFASLTHNIKMKATLNNIKYTIVRVGKATTDLETKVTYSDFKY